MPLYSVRPGDCLSSIAKQFGFRDWRTIYHHPRNAEFKKLRSNPNIIHPNDRLFIPDSEPKQVDAATEKRHKFRVRSERTLLRLCLKDARGECLAGKEYTLDVGGQIIKGKTDAKGIVEQVIPADASDAMLSVALDDAAKHLRTQWSLSLGSLDPSAEATGIQARLNNLGYFCGAVDGIIGPRTKAAVRRFQEANQLTVDGIAGPKTQAKLVELHGC